MPNNPESNTLSAIFPRIFPLASQLPAQQISGLVRRVVTQSVGECGARVASLPRYEMRDSIEIARCEMRDQRDARCEMTDDNPLPLRSNKMALASKFCGLSSQLFRNKVFFYNAARCYADKPMPWYTIWQPRVYSEKDHDKIAEKYNLHPKEYKPAPQEECIGDYPDMPMIGPAAKDPYYPYDIPTYRKNYKETVHHHFEIMGEDRFSYGYKYRIDLYLASAIFVAFMFTLFAIVYLLEPYPSFTPVMQKQYPQNNKVHYTFEPANP